MGDPHISVAVLTYNHEKYLADALASVNFQVVTRAVEVVIAVDASDDATLDIANHFASAGRFPTRVLQTDKRLGMQLNLRRLMAASRGKYIALLEGDDVWLSMHKLELQCNFLEKNPEICACCTRANVSFLPPVRREDNLWLTDRIPTLPSGLVPITNLTMMREMIPTASLMVKGERFRVLPEWLANLPMADWYFSVGSAASGGLVLLDEVTCTYRLHASGATLNTNVGCFTRGFLVLLRNLCFETQGESQIEVCKGLQEFMWQQASNAEAAGDVSVIEILDDLAATERRVLGSVSKRTRNWRLRLKFPAVYRIAQRVARAVI